MNFNPWRNIRHRDHDKPISVRKYINTFWQTVIDAFVVLAGETHFTLTASPEGSRIPIRIVKNLPVRQWDPYHHASLGFIDYSPFGLIKLIVHLALYLFHIGMFTLQHKIHRSHPVRNVFLYIGGGLAVGIGGGLFYLFSAIQFVVTAVITLLILPIVGIIHNRAQNEKSAGDQNFSEKYEQQAPVKNLLLENSDKKIYHLGKMKHMRVLLAAHSTKPEEDADLSRIYGTTRLVLYSRPVLNPHPQSDERNYFFYQFKYTKAGLAAFRALCEINKELCAHGKDRDKKITAMLLTFITLAQMTRGASSPLPIDMLEEIAIRVIDEDLTLDQRRVILIDAKETVRAKQRTLEATPGSYGMNYRAYPHMDYRAASSSVIEEVVDKMDHAKLLK